MRRLLCGLICLPIMACGGPTEAPAPKMPAAQNFHRELRGYEYRPDVMIDGEARLGYVQDALRDYQQAADNDLPARVTELKNTGCALPKPTEDDALMVIHVGGSKQDAAVHYVTSEHLNDAAERLVNAYQNYDGKMPALARFPAGRTMPVANVVVTETEKPVFLILISQWDIIWAFQTAEGANVREIVALTPGMLGLAHIPEGANVSTLYGSASRKCGITPARMPQDHWSFVQNTKRHGTGKDLLVENRQRAHTFRKQMRETFDLGLVTYIGDLRVSNFLVGPLPATEEEQVPYRSLAGADLMLSPSDYILISSPRDFRSQSESLVRQTAEAAAGGSLENLVTTAR